MFPRQPVEVTPEDFEEQVRDWLQQSGEGLVAFEVGHLRKLAGTSGEYEFDVVATFEALGGARFMVLVECKRVSRPVEREVLLALESKRMEVGAHKILVVATSRFQSGALSYAKAHGIATLCFIDGQMLYSTRNAGQREPTRSDMAGLGLPRFAGWWITHTPEGQTITVVGLQDVRPLQEWLSQRDEVSK